MPCDPIYGPGNKPVGFVCSKGPRKPAELQPCSTCGWKAKYLCDGPASQAGAKSCDKPVCARCAVSIRNLDLDFCRDCAGQLTPLGCTLAGAAGPPCMGALAPQAHLCVRHAVLFDHWLGAEGGTAVYARADLEREQKRDLHRVWLAALGPELAKKLLEARHAPA